MYRLRNRIQPYAWGSRTAIASLLGEPVPSKEPQAELWMGAHPSAPSAIGAEGAVRSLADCIAADPAATLGRQSLEKFGPRLPFLFKVLAAEEPLSLQAHPSIAQAEAGFDREQAMGIPLEAPHRNYKDRSHKPELLAAVTPFEALYGFREPAATRALFARLSVPSLDPLLAPLAEVGEAGLSPVFVSLLSLDPSRAAEIALAVGSACVREARIGGSFFAEYAWGARIAELYPADIGVAVALMLNLVKLAPGEAIYLPAGNLHAYLRGVGMEIMASSDNVLRGGLTRKHVDVPELARVVRFESTPPEVLTPVARGPNERIYETSAPEFRLGSVQLGDPDRAVHTIDGAPPAWTAADRLGPEILLCWKGRVEIDDGRHREALEPGGSVFVCGSTGRYTIRGAGTVFRATVGEGDCR